MWERDLIFLKNYSEELQAETANTEENVVGTTSDLTDVTHQQVDGNTAEVSDHIIILLAILIIMKWIHFKLI